MDYDHIRKTALERNLDIMGGLVPEPCDGAPENCATLLLLGPAEPGFWSMFTASAEYRDHAPHALDRWSVRVIQELAAEVGGQALFPFSGPPFLPFIKWALRSGRAWQSPVGMLVHDRCGLMVSYRGAVGLDRQLELPASGNCPCDSCSERPCLSACPVDALSAGSGFNVSACHDFLDTVDGLDCMTRGCTARRACPVSAGYGRLAAQSAFHMRAFHP